MKILNLILTIIYGLGAIYTIYMSAMSIFIYIANNKLGHFESPRLSIIYSVLAIILSIVSIIGYRIINQVPTDLLQKNIFYLPISLVLLYILWVILIIILAGGRWN